MCVSKPFNIDSCLVVRGHEEMCSSVGRKHDVSDLEHEVVVCFSLLWSK